MARTIRSVVRTPSSCRASKLPTWQSPHTPHAPCISMRHSAPLGREEGAYRRSMVGRGGGLCLMGTGTHVQVWQAGKEVGGNERDAGRLAVPQHSMR